MDSNKIMNYLKLKITLKIFNYKIVIIIWIWEKAINIQIHLIAQYRKKYRNYLKCKNMLGDHLE